MGTINNAGIMVTGRASLQAGQVAAGDHAHAGAAGADGAALAQLQARLDELLAQMRAHAAVLPAGAEAALATVRDELARPQPNKMVVTAVLDKVKETVQAIGSLAGLATAVRELAGIAL